MRLLPVSLAIAAALAITGATTAADCYSYDASGFNTDGEQLFSVTGTVHDRTIGGDEYTQYFEIENFELWEGTHATPYEHADYSQYKEWHEGEMRYAADLVFTITESAGKEIAFTIYFEQPIDIFTLQSYSNAQGTGFIYDHFSKEPITSQSSLTAVPGAGALPLAGLAGLAVGRRRRRGNK